MAHQNDYSSNLLIHIGYPKTGSTWLQEHVFNAAQFGFTIPWKESRAQAISDFVLRNPYKFRPSDVLEKYQDGLREASLNGLTAVLSDETLGGDPLRWFINPQLIGERLRTVFPNAKILICIREQKRAILSLYSEYIKHGGVANLYDFINADEFHLGKAPICDIVQLEYDLLIDHYMSIFGPSRVLVLPFELFVSNKQLFINRLIDFVGNKNGLRSEAIAWQVSNPSLDAVPLHIRRYLNMFSSKPNYTMPKQPLSFRINRLLTDVVGRLTPRSSNRYCRSRMTNFIDRKIGSRFGESNLRLEKLIDTSLAEFDYELGPNA